jgi:hypothetical protein
MKKKYFYMKITKFQHTEDLPYLRIILSPGWSFGKENNQYIPTLRKATIYFSLFLYENNHVVYFIT